MTFNYNISLSGLNAARYGLQVTQNNIANMDTEGYARQRVSLSVQDTITGKGVGGQIGNGVITEKIERIKDDLMIQQVRAQNTRATYFQTMESGLRNVESIMGELTDGSVTNIMNDFFNSWEELSKYPQENSYRESVTGKAQQLTFKLNSVSEDLRIYRNELDTKIEVDITDANSLIKQIASINKQIQNAETFQPNALFDKRDYYVEKLSSIGDVRVIQNSKDPNIVDVEFGGMLVVSGTDSQELKGLFDKAGDRWVLAVGNMPVRLEQGSLSANLEVRNTYIPEATKKLDELSNVIITEVNALHQNAFALDGTTGIPFFGGVNANTLHVNPDIVKNADLISISSVASEKGNADVARRMADLQDALIMPSGRNPIEDWTGFVVSLGQTLNSVSDSADVYDSVLNDLKQQKQSVQGVDFDEELAKLMQYEKNFQVNSRALKAVDDAFAELLKLL